MSNANLTVFFNATNARVLLRDGENAAETKMARDAKKHTCELLGREIVLRGNKKGEPEVVVDGAIFKLFEGKGGSWYCYLESNLPVAPKDWFKS